MPIVPRPARLLWLLALPALWGSGRCSASPAAAAITALQVSPRQVRLDSPEATQQLLISAQQQGRPVDLTWAVTFTPQDPKVATVEEGGLVRPQGEGRTEIVVRRGAVQVRVPVEVRGLKTPIPISFENQVIPILTKAGCNSGGCHGKAEGQHGFKLSVFGFDPKADYEALVMEGRGRRLSLLQPDQSLLLLKATAGLPHGGGRRIEKTSLPYRRLRRWLAEGAHYEGQGAAPAVRVVVEPEQQILRPKATQQLRVTAIDAQGNRRCVTSEAEFSSNAGTIADVDSRGTIQASDIPGEAAILVRYMGNVAVCRVTTPRTGVSFTRPPEAGFIDRLVWDKLQRLGIPPSGAADDATFMRRAYLDVIGTLPTPDETRAFLAECARERGEVAPVAKSSLPAATAKPSPEQRPALKARAQLVDRLLERPEYADYWTMRWSDILRVDKDAITPQGAVAMTRWLRHQFTANRPYDELVRDILTATGDTTAEGPAAFYKALDTPEIASRSVSQLFLGVRIECARCHHHPSERWGQDDYYALAGFFTGIGKKKLPSGVEAVTVQPGEDLKHPRTSQPIRTRALGAAPVELAPDADRREVLAAWMTGPENAFFARSLANRLWAHYFGRGLVEPEDDLRATNPATNEPLLDALARHLREVKYDLKAFTRTLLASRVYQLTSAANPGNKSDEQNFSHAMEKALPAEVLIDAICQTTGVAEKYNGWPEGYRAIQIWDNRVPSYFFQIFGRPVRASVCECERSTEPSIAQALHLMNSPEISDKVHARSGTARRLAESALTPAQIIEELSLLTHSRPPTERERATLLKLFEDGSGDRRAAVEDALWSLLNTKEFLYNH